MTRDESEYERRLVDFARRWEAKYPEDAAALRAECQRAMGMHAPPPAGSLRWLALEQRFRDEVAKRNNKPSLREFLTGAA